MPSMDGLFIVSFVFEAEVAMEELRLFRDNDSLEGMREKLDSLCMVLILSILEGIRKKLDRFDQLLTGNEIPSMDDLIIRHLHVPIKVKTENSVGIVETFAMVYIKGRGSHEVWGRGSRSGRP